MMATEQKVVVSGGGSILFAIFVVLAILKLAGVAPVSAWSWWLVTLPLWAPWAAFAALAAVICAGLLIAGFVLLCAFAGTGIITLIKSRRGRL